MATAAIKTKRSASFAMTIEAIRIGSKTTAVSTLAIDGGMPANLDFGFCLGVWGFNFWWSFDDDLFEPFPYRPTPAGMSGRGTPGSGYGPALCYPLATASGSVSFSPPKRRPLFW